MEEDFNLENLKDVYKDVPKTLRLVVSLASQPYDILGLQASLMGQLRHTVSTGMTMTKGCWESTVSPELWEFFCTQLLQLHMTCLFKNPRVPAGAITGNNSCDLLILSDASTSQIIQAFLLYQTPDGVECSLLFARSYLSNSSTTVPRIELQA